MDLMVESGGWISWMDLVDGSDGWHVVRFGVEGMRRFFPPVQLLIGTSSVPYCSRLCCCYGTRMFLMAWLKPAPREQDLAALLGMLNSLFTILD